MALAHVDGRSSARENAWKCSDRDARCGKLACDVAGRGRLALDDGMWKPAVWASTVTYISKIFVPPRDDDLDRVRRLFGVLEYAPSSYRCNGSIRHPTTTAELRQNTQEETFNFYCYF